ncbi:Histone H2B type 1-A like protein [Argiope bruennichi]|uniref:Histone H2B type 1-A like protein n=1 Tax=Argiope bruennichi TaxID=94029 RepID=A0A8T0ELG0_ARGBR|nr:Histone H2B type 1-A like protein [Argiope bruennichi]
MNETSDENNLTFQNSALALPESYQRFKNLMDLTSTKMTKKRTPKLNSSFKGFVLRVRHHIHPKMKLGAQTLKELDNFIVHMINLLETEIKRLNELKPQKTLSHEHLETAVKLCLPGNLAQASNEFAKLAVRAYFEKIWK